jgi:hypothetical protein
MILPGSYANGFAPRDGQPLYPELWRGCVGAWNPGLGPTGLTLRDWSGYGNHGTLTNMDAGTDWVASQGKYALNFDAVDDGVALQNVTITAAPFTICAWFRVADVTAYRTIFSLNAIGADSNYYALQSRGDVSGDPLEFLVRSSLGPVAVRTSTSVVAGVWQFACAVEASPTDHRVYLNGAGVGSSTTARTPTGLDTATIGLYRGSVPDGAFNGDIDDVRVFNRALSVSEIRLLATRRGIAYEMAPRRRSSSAVQFNRRRRLLIGASS